MQLRRLMGAVVLCCACAAPAKAPAAADSTAAADATVAADAASTEATATDTVTAELKTTDTAVVETAGTPNVAADAPAEVGAETAPDVVAEVAADVQTADAAADQKAADDVPPSDACVPNCKPDCTDGCGGNCDGEKCEDGVACTVGDTCKAGKCTYATMLCLCQNDADCAGKNGPPPPCGATYVCDKSTPNWGCKVSVPGLKCDTSGDSACKKTSCDLNSGKCQSQIINQDNACDDGDACTEGDVCNEGLCVGSANVCQCKTNADCAKFEDGDLCNGTLKCSVADGQCLVDPATTVKCDTTKDTVCLKTLCDSKAGKCSQASIETLAQSCPADQPNCGKFVPLPAGVAPNTVPCDDGDACTASSFCGTGKCVTEVSALLCKCTDDALCAKYGTPCTGPLVCDKVNGVCKVNAAVAVVCDAKNDKPCLKNVCPPPTGKCMMLPPSCSDGNNCTADSCDGDGCKNVKLPDGSACGASGGKCTAGVCSVK